MSQLLRKAKRIGTKPVRYLIEIEVERVSYTVSKGLDNGAKLSVAFHRGPKVSLTETDAIFQNGGAEWNDKAVVSQLCTLYIDNNQEFMKKVAKLTVRRQAWSAKQALHHVGVGVVEINLAEFVSSTDQSTYKVLPLMKCRDPHATIAVCIKTQWLKDSAVSDDTLSSTSLDSISVCSFPEAIPPTISPPPKRPSLHNPFAAQSIVEPENEDQQIGKKKWQKARDMLLTESKEVKELGRLNELLQRENAELMQQLIESKVACAEISMKVYEYEKKTQDMAKQIRQYSSHSTGLEVKLTRLRQKFFKKSSN